jgi:DNA polymerase I
MEKLVLIDSNAIIHRAYHALPKNMSTSKGEMTNAVYGYTTTLIKILEDLKPEYIAASFDVSKATFRHEAYKEYKATRVAADQELYDQIPKVRELLEVLNIPIFEKKGYEADDCIGTIATRIQNTDNRIQIYIVSGDKDLFQLLNGDVFVYWLKKGLSESAIVDSAKIREDFNLDPGDFIDLKALAGDASDNIPGVPGIGPKTATELIIKFDTLLKLYEEIKNRKSKSPEVIAEELKIKPRILGLLIEHKEQALMSQSLATIERNVPIKFSLEDCKWGEYDKDKLKDFFERMQFHSLLRRFGAEVGRSEKIKEQAKKDSQLKLL